MIVMGIDASTTSTGWSIFNNNKLVDYGVIKPKGENWRERLENQGPLISKIIEKYKPEKVYMEDVPLSVAGGIKTGIILGAVQGFVYGLFSSYSIKILFVSPTNWRSKVGIFNGKRNGTKREALKKASIEKANTLFGINLKWVSPSSIKNEDDISDAILVAYSQIKSLTF